MRPPVPSARFAVRTGLLLVLVVIGILTLRPNPGDTAAPAQFSLCVACGYTGGVDFLLNLLLFVPLGALLAAAGLPFARGVGIAFAVTCVIELLQLTVIPGRFASPGDLLSNTLGAAVGHLIAGRWRLLVRPDPPAARVLGGWALASWGLVIFGTAWLLQPAYPASWWFGQWAPELSGFAQYTGTVSGARLDGAPLPPHRTDRTPAMRAGDPGSRPLTLEGVGTTGHPTDRVAPIVSVYDDAGRGYRRGLRTLERQVALLGQDGQDLIFATRTRAHDARLRPLQFRVPGALTGPPGDSLVVRGTRARGRLTALARTPAGTVADTLRLTPGLGWSLLLPFDRAIPSTLWWPTTLWLAGLTLLVGRYARRGWPARPAATLVVPGLALAGWFGLVTWAAGFPAPAWTAWAGIGAGLLAGWATALLPGDGAAQH